MLSKSYITRIHIAKSKLKLDDDAYYAMLSIYGVESSKELTEAQADHLLETFKKMGWEPGKKHNSLGARPANFATPRQLRYIEALWNGFANEKTDEALRKFTKRITGKDQLTFITKYDAHCLIKSIEVMKKDKEEMLKRLAEHKNKGANTK